MVIKGEDKRDSKQGIAEIMKEIRTLVAKDNEENLSTGKDFNARIGNTGTIIQEQRIYVYRNKRNSIIDYAIGNTEVREKIDRLVIEERTESDHNKRML